MGEIKKMVYFSDTLPCPYYTLVPQVYSEKKSLY